MERNKSNDAEINNLIMNKQSLLASVQVTYKIK